MIIIWAGLPRLSILFYWAAWRAFRYTRLAAAVFL